MLLLYHHAKSNLIFFRHFNAVFWFYGNSVINFQSETLNRLLCDCATGMIYVVGVPNFPLFQSSINFKWDTGSKKNNS